MMESAMPNQTPVLSAISKADGVLMSFRMRVKADRFLRPAGAQKGDIKKYIVAICEDEQLLWSVEPAPTKRGHPEKTVSTSVTLEPRHRDLLHRVKEAKGGSISNILSSAIEKKAARDRRR
jgi:hypothetical protein